MRHSLKYLFALAAVPLFAASMASATTITFTNAPFSTGVLLGTYMSPTAPSFTVNGQGTSGTGGVNGGFIQQSGQGNLVPGVGGLFVKLKVLRTAPPWDIDNVLNVM